MALFTIKECSLTKYKRYDDKLTILNLQLIIFKLQLIIFNYI